MALATRRTTIILSPHPDDEVIRLAHYIAIAADRGDKMILVQATDGSASAVARTLGITPEELAAFRYTEQNHAWDWLTNGQGEIIRLGLKDGASRADAIYSGTRAVFGRSIPQGAELYVATWHHDRETTTAADKHADHVNCVLAGRRLAGDGVVVRYAMHPTVNTGGQRYLYRNVQQQVRVEGAVASYQPIGARSTKNLRLVMTNQNRVTS